MNLSGTSENTVITKTNYDAADLLRYLHIFGTLVRHLKMGVSSLFAPLPPVEIFWSAAGICPQFSWGNRDNLQTLDLLIF